MESWHLARVWLAAAYCLSLFTLTLRASDWVAGQGSRYRELKLPATGKTYFQELPASVTGITFTNFLSEEKGLENSLTLSGSGVAAGDIDGDGWCDLFFCAMEGPSALYRNSGNWKFEEITAAAGLPLEARY